MPTPSNLPHLKFTRRIGSQQEYIGTQLYDVKFFPFEPSEPIFVVVGNQHVIVARLLDGPNESFETLCYWKDQDAMSHDRPSANSTQFSPSSLNSVCWARDPKTGDPLVCVSGTGANIKVLNVRTNSLVRTLAGHGRPVNDLAVNPVRPYIIASGSEDHTVRIWDLSADHRQPCAAILAGHIKGLLCLSWHHSGLYLLSGGQDAAICLWVMPSIHIWPDIWQPGLDGDTDKSDEHDAANTSEMVLNITEPAIIHHPHFRTTEVHTDMVDSVTFYDSLIFSKGAEDGNNRIILWRIPGFDPHPQDCIYTRSSPKPPMPPRFFATGPAAESDDETRSAFNSKDQLKLEQLLTLDITGADYFYIRMGLLSAGEHSALTFANGDGLVSFWDLPRLEESLLRKSSSDTSYEIIDFDDDPILGVDPLPSETRRSISPAQNDNEDEDATGPIKPGRRHRRKSSRADGFSPKSSNKSIADQVNPPGLSAKAALAQRQRVGNLAGREVTASPFLALPAHHTIQISKPTRFNARGVAWSTEGYGRWCVVVGDMGIISVFERSNPSGLSSL